MVWNTQHLLSWMGAKEVKMQFPHHPLLSDKPLHRESVLTILSMSFFHSMPSDVTRYHSLHTSSAAHNDLASRYDRMFSAMWSNPRAEGGKKKKGLFAGETLSLKQLPLIVQRYPLFPSTLLHAELDQMHRRAFAAKFRSEQCSPTSFGYNTTSH